MPMDAIRPWIGFGLRVFIGGYFLYAALPKISEPLAFATSIGHYGLMPYWMVNAYALIIPWLELLVGGCLVVGYRVRTNAVLAGIMLVMFTFAVTWAVVCGLQIDCGCFGADNSETVSWEKVAKNCAFIAMCGYLWWKPVTALSLENGLWGAKK